METDALDAAARRSALPLSVVVVTWLAALALALLGLAVYGATPGRAADAPHAWPRDARVTRVEGAPTLVVTIHAYCPCSRATLASLETLLASERERPQTVVLFEIPDRVSDEEAWASPTYVRAQTLPGATVVLDRGAREAALFGTYTSGQALLYGADGMLRFAGGLTPSRGEEGPSASLAALHARLDARGGGRIDDTPASAPVFGCPARALP